MGYVGWALFVLSIIWYIKSMNFSHRKRLNQNYLVTYLLLSDDIREWIRSADAPNPEALAQRAFSAIENLADRLATGTPGQSGVRSSVFGAAAMIWECKQGTKSS